MGANGTEYAFTLPDGSQRFEIVCERGDVARFQRMHGATSARPVGRDQEPPARAHDVPPAELPPIPSDWEDRTWREDVNPCWHVPAAGVNVWCGRADPKNRPAEAPARFTVWDDATGADVLHTEEWGAVLAIIAARAEIVKARDAMQSAADSLTSYLLDETETGFEGIPDVDAARTTLLAMLEPTQ